MRPLLYTQGFERLLRDTEPGGGRTLVRYNGAPGQDHNTLDVRRPRLPEDTALLG